MPKTKQPADAQTCIDTIYYKIGRHGLPFMFINGKWIKSSRTAHEIKKEIIRQQHSQEVYEAKKAAVTNKPRFATGNKNPLNFNTNDRRYMAIYA